MKNPPNPAMLVTSQTLRSAPLPTPEDLAKYENVHKGAAEKIIEMAYKQSMHRMELEKYVAEKDFSLHNKGQNYALSVAVIGIMAATYLGYIGQTTVASILAGSGLGIIVLAFLGKKHSASEKK